MGEDRIDNEACNKTRLMNRMIGNSSRLTQELNKRMKQEFSLSLAKYDVLMAIERAEDGEITMSNLSRELLVSNANMTGMTSRLQADGLVEKKTMPSDRRIYSVALTEEGRTRLEQAIEKHGIWIRELMDCIDSDEVNFMNSFLDKMDKQTDSFSEND
ncbi:MarR family winged helix-turn-helix transcriptional regulator [Pseudemcibacter aquimaris]|uniref:MarR family winged helix-turn-helix transcriptional regulator n=1 Tax=Pseudemcibacter aquimaris TaxID=2857064 RepID=UPI002012CF40|nr:MarR family transcriptional regulator [Pseudemcibacter aquimaris]MCC3860344.1 MarR family transcriptional regulator [Pseudemcibacter aquimaris]WDU57670.1 MarR family transcriptional regulator [Pseudemcibacter aquimaris]